MTQIETGFCIYTNNMTLTDSVSTCACRLLVKAFKTIICVFPPAMSRQTENLKMKYEHKILEVKTEKEDLKRK